MTTARSLKPGYQVTLKTGNILMTVAEVDEESGQVTLLWHLESGDLQQATVPAEALQLRKKSNP